MSNNHTAKTQYKMNKKKKEIKKDVQGIILIVIISILLVIAIAVGFVFLNSLDNGNAVSYPSNPLVSQSTSSYTYVESDDLPVKVTMPNAPIMCDLGGSARSVSDNGFMYLYSKDLYLGAYEVHDSTYDIFSNQLVADMYAGEVSYMWVYTMAHSNTGYYNGYPTKYECGECSLLDDAGKLVKSIYVISFTMDMGLEYPLALVAATPNSHSLYNAGKLLEKAGNAVMDISKTNYVSEAVRQSEGVLGEPVIW